MAFFFYKAKPRQFKYRPIYFDPEKEALEHRREQLTGKRSDKPDSEQYEAGSILRSQIRARRGDIESMRRNRQGKTLKLVLLIAVLVLLAALIFMT